MMAGLFASVSPRSGWAFRHPDLVAPREEKPRARTRPRRRDLIEPEAALMRPPAAVVARQTRDGAQGNRGPRLTKPD